MYLCIYTFWGRNRLKLSTSLSLHVNREFLMCLAYFHRLWHRLYHRTSLLPHPRRPPRHPWFQKSSIKKVPVEIFREGKFIPNFRRFRPPAYFWGVRYLKRIVMWCIRILHFKFFAFGIFCVFGIYFIPIISKLCRWWI